MNSRTLFQVAFDVDGTAQLFDIGPDDVHSDPASADIGYLSRR